MFHQPLAQDKKLFLTSLLLLPFTTLYAHDVTTLDLIAASKNALPSCVNWQIVGQCSWLHCSFDGCKVRTSVKIGHYQPDLVVSVYSQFSQHPWREIRVAYEAIYKNTLDRIVRTRWNSPSGGGVRRNRSLHFFEADAIGHPVESLQDYLPHDYACWSQTERLQNYFASAFDALAWRESKLESLQPPSLIPGLREVGTWPINTWGSVYPRSGWVAQPDPAKAAAVVAQRVGDIVTRRNQGHVYRHVQGSKTGVWPPGPLVEHDSDTGTWQMVSPKVDSSCSAFGENDSLSAESWSHNRVNQSRSWVWNLWRPYKCCARRGQVFLFDVDWREYP